MYIYSFRLENQLTYVQIYKNNNNALAITAKYTFWRADT